MHIEMYGYSYLTLLVTSQNRIFPIIWASAHWNVWALLLDRSLGLVAKGTDYTLKFRFLFILQSSYDQKHLGQIHLKWLKLKAIFPF